MAELFVLLYGKSKKRAHPIMVDTFDKCDKYRMSRENSGVVGWHAIKHAEPGDKTWRQKSATRGGNKCESVAMVNRPTPGYVDKHGFHPHT